MVTVYGMMEYSLLYAGSKSEGYWAVLKCDDGKEYTLYRSGEYPVGDDFFAPFHGKRVVADGKPEERTGYFCVTAIREEEEKSESKS